MMSIAEFVMRFKYHKVVRVLRNDSDAENCSGKTKAAQPRPKSATSNLETIFATQILAMQLPAAVREHHFHPDRKWRMDFAWPDKKIAVEIEGGVWGLGRHNRPKGFIADTEKYNAAAALGWTVLRFTGKHIRSGQAIDQLVTMLAGRPATTEEASPMPTRNAQKVRNRP